MMATDNIKPHQETYSSVMSMLKWGTVAVLIITAVVVLLIAS
jgi:Bacterial aa3 type cytochrome c oxidase subunit IV